MNKSQGNKPAQNKLLCSLTFHCLSGAAKPDCAAGPSHSLYCIRDCGSGGRNPGCAIEPPQDDNGGDPRGTVAGFLGLHPGKGALGGNDTGVSCGAGWDLQFLVYWDGILAFGAESEA